MAVRDRHSSRVWPGCSLAGCGPKPVRTQKANTPARRGWNADRAQPFLVIAARDASSISDDRQKSGQVLVRTEPIIQMILGRFRGGMSGVLNLRWDLQDHRVRTQNTR